MKITVDIENIDYEKVIDKALPLLKDKAASDNNAVLKIVSGILNMPGDIPKKMLNALPQETKNDIVIYFFEHSREKVIEMVQAEIDKNNLGITLGNIEIEKEDVSE